MGKEVGAGWGIMPGVMFLVLWGCTQRVAWISLGCVRFMDVGWSGRGDALGKGSVSFLNIMGKFIKCHCMSLRMVSCLILYFSYCLD